MGCGFGKICGVFLVLTFFGFFVLLVSGQDAPPPASDVSHGARDVLVNDYSDLQTALDDVLGRLGVLEDRGDINVSSSLTGIAAPSAVEGVSHSSGEILVSGFADLQAALDNVSARLSGVESRVSGVSSPSLSGSVARDAVADVSHSSREIMVSNYSDLQAALDDILPRLAALEAAFMSVDGRCGAGRNNCSAGTVNDAVFADTSSYYHWRCDGLNGGRNSSQCNYAKPYTPPPSSAVTCPSFWSPARSTVCRGTYFDQARNCPDDCNSGDCRESRIASGTKTGCSGADTPPEPAPSVVTCTTSWSPAPLTKCRGKTFTQTRSCPDDCNSGDCSESQDATGTKTGCSGADTPPEPTPSVVTCTTSWSPAPSTKCRGKTFTQTRSCPDDCNSGDCSERRTAIPGTKQCCTPNIVCRNGKINYINPSCSESVLDHCSCRYGCTSSHPNSCGERISGCRFRPV